MKLIDLITTTMSKIRQRPPIVEGGHAIHVEIQKKGFEAALSCVSASLAHELNQHLDDVLQCASVDFLRSENARLWDERQKLVVKKNEKMQQSSRLALKGFVEQSNIIEREIFDDIDSKITILNEKIQGIRIALDHSIHAGGDLFSERVIQPTYEPHCYRVKDKDLKPVFAINDESNS
ncbi:hypothetical protein ACRZ5S_23090 (plasmid) [Vibrio scophthalmi]|uniref:hypothetical protein n=1 Tax=Vibrio scophthalmi TaxID=45658 RepID=UPI003EBEB935